MKSNSESRNMLTPFAWRLYRVGLATGGLAWICIASTLCGCSGANGWVKNQSGRGYYHRGNYAAARAEFERALLDNPYRATYAYNVGKAMEKEGDVAGAEQMYQHALTLDPSHQPAYRGMAELLAAQGRQDEATELLTAWAQTQPYSAASHVELAQLYRKSGNVAAAEQEVNTALQIRPRYRQALNERTRINRLTGRTARGGAYSELALTSRMAPPAMTPGAVAFSPQNSAALNMAANMPKNDPTLAAGAIQAAYSHPQFSAAPAPMVSAAPQMYQVNRPAGPESMASGWTPVEHGAMASAATSPHSPAASPMPMNPAMISSPGVPVQGMSTQGIPAQGMMMVPAQMSAVPTSGLMPMGTSQPMPTPMSMPPQMSMPMSTQMQATVPQSIPVPTPVQQPVELGQPVPVTQAIPGEMNPGNLPGPSDAPLFSSTGAPMVSAAPTVQAF